eukprot:EG_transcript_22460
MPPKKDAKPKAKAKAKGKTATEELTEEDFVNAMFYLPPEHEKERRQRAQARVQEACRLFERDRTGTCDSREVGTIVRSLGLNPTEEQMRRIMEDVEEEDPNGFIKFARLQPILIQILLNEEYCSIRKGEVVVDKYQRQSEPQLLHAFRMLDEDGRGRLDAEHVKELLLSLGDRFTDEEVVELVNAAADPETGLIHLEEFASTLALE